MSEACTLIIPRFCSAKYSGETIEIRWRFTALFRKWLRAVQMYLEIVGVNRKQNFNSPFRSVKPVSTMTSESQGDK